MTSTPSQPEKVTPAKFTSGLVNLLNLGSFETTSAIRSGYLDLIDGMLQMHAHQDTVTRIIAQVIGRLKSRTKKIRALDKLQQTIFELTADTIPHECTQGQVDAIKKDLDALQDIFNEAYKLNEPYQYVLLLGLWYKTIEEIAFSKGNAPRAKPIMEHAVNGLIAALKTNKKDRALIIFGNFFPNLVGYIK